VKFEKLTVYKRFIGHINSNWDAFRSKRAERLYQKDRYGDAAEKVTENITEDLLTIGLDWNVGDINNQVGYADLLVTHLGIKHLIIETKRPGALAWNECTVYAALEQARRYADEQKVKCIGVTDGVMFYAADIEAGGLKDRILVSLEQKEPPFDLWWISEHGIYRPRTDSMCEPLNLLQSQTKEDLQAGCADSDSQLLHPKYKLPSHCFAYVGDANNPKTWKLPYLQVDGTVDVNRLPKAIQAILSNYRGAKVSFVPEKHISDVLMRLEEAAERIGKMPHQGGKTAPAYEMLAVAIDQIRSSQ
jgi:hypothetical protein